MLAVVYMGKRVLGIQNYRCLFSRYRPIEVLKLGLLSTCKDNHVFLCRYFQVSTTRIKVVSISSMNFPAKTIVLSYPEFFFENETLLVLKKIPLLNSDECVQPLATGVAWSSYYWIVNNNAGKGICWYSFRTVLHFRYLDPLRSLNTLLAILLSPTGMNSGSTCAFENGQLGESRFSWLDFVRL